MSQVVERFKNIIIYSKSNVCNRGNSRLSRNGCDDASLNYICNNYGEIECELNGGEYEKPEKHNYDCCVACNKMLLDYRKSILVCTNCGLCECYPVYVNSYNHLMKPLRRKCVYKRLDNFKVILNQFCYGGKQFVPDDVMNAIRSEIHNRDNILYSYTIPIMIPMLKCILKRNKMAKCKSSIYYIFFKLSNQPFPYISTKESNLILNVFDVVSTIYDKYKPKGRKSFLNYTIVLKEILIMRGMDQYA